MERDRYLDLLRVAAIGGVVYGHWLLISVTYRNVQLSGADALRQRLAYPSSVTSGCVRG
jgi:hypothetical protein